MFDLHPLLILVIGIVTVVLMITLLRMNAFIALITSAIVVSLLAPGQLAEKISRVATAFGSTAGSIGIVIALAVVVGKCMMDSGAADRIVRAFLSLLGEKRAATALMASGYVLAVPVFFDTVFYLLVPLARSMYRRTKKHYLKYAMAIAAGGIITHSLVPPTPGPLIMAENLGIDIGVMILVGALIALPASIVGMFFCGWADRRMNIQMRPLGGELSEPELLKDTQLPGLFVSLLPIVLPVLLVSTNTIVSALAKGAAEGSPLRRAAGITAVLGNVNLAMLMSMAIAMWTLKSKRKLTNAQLAKVAEVSLMSGGIIILITAAGGAFGAMLKAAQIGPAIENLFKGDSGQPASGLMLLVLGALIAAVMKIAQGSTTVAMIASSAMIAAMLTSTETLGYHRVYLATAIGGGSMIGSWMNDSGFWIFVKMTGLTEAEGIKSWTPLLAIVGFTAVVVSSLLAAILPMAPHPQFRNGNWLNSYQSPVTNHQLPITIDQSPIGNGFGPIENRKSKIVFADDSAFRPFVVHMSLAQAIAQITEDNAAEVQAFQTIFETGQNNRGYVHKLECHAEATEFIYAVTDIVYGVMLPSNLSFGPKQVVADPKKVQLFYLRSGEVIALHPYVLHSGSLSVEPDRSFSVVIYKKPVDDAKELVVKLPESCAQWQNCLKIENVDKFYLTLEELHTPELKANCGYIASKKPIRLPVW